MPGGDRHALPHRRAQGQRRPQDCGPRTNASAEPVQRTAHHAQRHDWAASPARLPPATSTPAWATRRRSTPPSRRWLRGTPTRNSTTRPASTRASTCWSATTTTSCRRSATGSQQRLQAFLAWLLGAAQRLRPQTRQSGRRRGLETPPAGNVTRARRPRRPFRRHAAADSSARLPSRGRTPTPPSGPYPLQQPRHARQLDDHARNHEGAWKAAAGISPTSSSTATAAEMPTKTRSTAKSPPLADYVNAHPTSHRRRRAGPVRRNDQHDRRRPARGYFLSQCLRQQVVQRRHRDGSGLRHRADQVQQQVAGPRPAVGHRAGVVPAGRRSLAGGDEHRPSQRRLVPRLPADHPPADGPHLPQRHAASVPSERPRTVDCWPTSIASTRSTKSPSSPAPARPGFSG